MLGLVAADSKVERVVPGVRFLERLLPVFAAPAVGDRVAEQEEVDAEGFASAAAAAGGDSPWQEASLLTDYQGGAIKYFWKNEKKQKESLKIGICI